MKPLFLMVLLLGIGFAGLAQWRLSGIEVNAMPGLGLHQYTQDSLIFQRRQGNSTVSASVHFPLMLHWQNGSRSSIYTGVGVRIDDFTMNKYNFADLLFGVIIMPWGGRFHDSVALQRVRFTNSALTLPLAYDYRITRRKDAGVFVHFRALVVPGFALKRYARAYADSCAGLPIPSPAELKQIGEIYAMKSEPFSLFFAPEINLRTRERKGKLSVNFSIQPFGFDVVQPTRALFKGNGFLRTALGLAYHW